MVDAVLDGPVEAGPVGAGLATRNNPKTRGQKMSIAHR
jgi:hypothetical protein